MTLEVKNRRESDIYRSKFRSKNELEGKAKMSHLTSLGFFCQLNPKSPKISNAKVVKGDNQIKFSMSQISGSGDPRVQISPNFGCRPYGPCRIDCAGQPAASSKKIVRFSQNNFLRLRTGLRSSDFKFF